MTDEVRREAQVTVRLEPPDVLFVAIQGDLDEADIHAITAEVRTFTERGRQLFTLADLTQLGSITAAARKASLGTQGIQVRGGVIVGASFHIRVIATLIGKAIGFALKRPVPIAFVATEAEGRAWIEAQRRAGDEALR